MSTDITISVKKEMGDWTIRINGRYVESFWREATARRIAMNIAAAIYQANEDAKAARLNTAPVDSQ